MPDVYQQYLQVTASPFNRPSSPFSQLQRNSSSQFLCLLPSLVSLLPNLVFTPFLNLMQSPWFKLVPCPWQTLRRFKVYEQGYVVMICDMFSLSLHLWFKYKATHEPEFFLHQRNHYAQRQKNKNRRDTNSKPNSQR